MLNSVPFGPFGHEHSRDQTQQSHLKVQRPCSCTGVAFVPVTNAGFHRHGAVQVDEALVGDGRGAGGIWVLYLGDVSHASAETTDVLRLALNVRLCPSEALIVVFVARITWAVHPLAGFVQIGDVRRKLVGHITVTCARDHEGLKARHARLLQLIAVGAVLLDDPSKLVARVRCCVLRRRHCAA